MKLAKNEYFFDFKTLTLQNKFFKYKKRELKDIYNKPKKDRTSVLLNFYSKPSKNKRLKLKKFFLSQLFMENKKIFKIIGFQNKHFLKKMFLKKNSKNTVLTSIERRLDLNLVRSRLLPSVKMAQQAIKYGFVYINKTKMTSDKYIVKHFDVITINPNFFFLTILPNVKTTFKRYKLKKEAYSLFQNILNNNFNKLATNFNINVFNILLNKSSVSVFSKIQILILLSIFLTKKNKLTKKLILVKLYSKFYYINRIKLNYKNLIKLYKKN